VRLYGTTIQATNIQPSVEIIAMMAVNLKQKMFLVSGCLLPVTGYSNSKKYFGCVKPLTKNQQHSATNNQKPVTSNKYE